MPPQFHEIFSVRVWKCTCESSKNIQKNKTTQRTGRTCGCMVTVSAVARFTVVFEQLVRERVLYERIVRQARKCTRTSIILLHRVVPSLFHAFLLYIVTHASPSRIVVVFLQVRSTEKATDGGTEIENIQQRAKEQDSFEEAFQQAFEL